MTERWRPIPGYEHAYAINRAGEVLSRRRVIHKRDGTRQRIRARILASMKHDKLKTVVLSDGGVQRRFYVHRLVAEAFGEERKSA